MLNPLSPRKAACIREHQASTLLPAIFSRVELADDRRLTVLNIGPALPETVAFFADFRCRLHFADLYADLPFTVSDEDSLSPRGHLAGQFRQLLALPAGTQLDICLFWDLFNFLDQNALGGLLDALRPYIHESTLAHGFSMHSPRAPQLRHLYGIENQQAISIRERVSPLPGYAPHSQRQLQSLLDCFRVERSLLLADKRLELLLHALL